MKKIVSLLAFVALLVLVGCEEERRGLRISSEGEMRIIVQTSSPHYDEVASFLEDSEIEGDGFGGYELSATEYSELEAILPTPSPEQVQKAEIWHEQWEHLENIDAFDAAMAKINEDKIMDLEEALFFCTGAPQWLSMMKEAQNYVATYAEIDPETVEETPGLANLGRVAKERQSAIEAVMAECPDLLQ